MSDTPETDAFVNARGATWDAWTSRDLSGLENFARSLERRLQEAHDMCDRYAEQLQAALREVEEHNRWISMSERRPARGEIVALYDAMFDKVNVCRIDCKPEEIDPDYTHWIRTPSSAALAKKGKL